MGVTLELYLRDQVIRGELSAGQGRPLDVLNTAGEGYVILDNALAGSLHVDALPIRLGTVRVHREQILLVVPHDSSSRMAPLLRAGWVEKKRVRVMVGLGPLMTSGVFHVGSWEGDQFSVEHLARGQDGRIFLPATEATVRSVYDPSWSVECPSVFIPRPAISYLALLEVTSESESSEGQTIEQIYRRLNAQAR